MARPLKNGLDYFPHDVDASTDEKIEALRAIHQNDGYAFYFILLERIYRTNEGELDISDAETLQILARKVSVTPEKFKEILKTALKYDCFDNKEYEKRGVLTSRGIKKRINVVIEKRLYMRENYKERVSDAETTQENNQETTPETPQSKEKKSKEKKHILPNGNEEKRFDHNAYINKMFENKQRHIRIIGKYFQIKKMSFPTKEAIGQAIKRNVKPSSHLVDYSSEAMAATVDWLEKQKLDWTLETVVKHIPKFNKKIL